MRRRGAKALLRSGSPGAIAFLFLHRGGAFADALAKVSKFCAPDSAATLDFDFINARRIDREDSFHTFAIADAANGKALIQAAATAANDDAGEYLDSFLIAFDDFRVHAHAV